MNEKESCPLCHALPADWVDDPHKSRDGLFMAMADLRVRSKVGEKPMLSDLPQVIGDRLESAKQIISAFHALTSGLAGNGTWCGRDAGQWAYSAKQWLLMEPE